MNQPLDYNFSHFSINLTSLWNKSIGPEIDEKFLEFLTPTEKKMKEPFISKEVGFYDWPEECSNEELDRIEETVDTLKKECSGVMIFGIGGSHLGGATLLKALSNSPYPLHYVSNVDPSAIEQANKFIENHNPCGCVVISKSGSTMETLCAYTHYSNHFDKKHTVVITDPHQGELRRLATENKLISFSLPSNIGGRFSVLTSVGLFPAKLGGIDIRKCIQGAKDLRTELGHFSAPQNPAYLYALALYLWDTRFYHNVQYLMPYWESVDLLAHWYVQLWGESLGKSLPNEPSKNSGPTPVAALGTRDQHSVLQLFKEGPRNKVVGFLDILSTKSTVVGACALSSEKLQKLSEITFERLSHLACQATEQSLSRSEIPTYRITLKQITPEALGALFFFWQLSCAFAAELYGVNAYDQPGVEEAKVLLRDQLP